MSQDRKEYYATLLAISITALLALNCAGCSNRKGEVVDARPYLKDYKDLTDEEYEILMEGPYWKTVLEAQIPMDPDYETQVEDEAWLRSRKMIARRRSGQDQTTSDHQ